MRPTLICTFYISSVLVSGCESPPGPESAEEGTASLSAGAKRAIYEYAGTGACAQCHQSQHRQWSGSHHELAMQPAGEATVLGDFSDLSFEHLGTTSTFFRRGSDFFVNTPGADDIRADHQIAYTFGVEPLQQYLIRVPDGRLQALGIAWDSRPKSSGGQRWFQLYPDEAILPGDPLHWSQPNQNWNYMCADCHSTNIDKRFDLVSRRYDTTWSEINVGCEACHGPGSHHIELMRAGNRGAAGRGFKVALSSAGTEIDSCAPCHSRRSLIAAAEDSGEEFLDRYLPSLLDESLYHPDGQILDEVYVYGSFLQSKMYQRGVRCSDCHDPHGASLKAFGNELCTRCHQEQPDAQFPTLRAKTYDSPEHHFHERASPGAQCVACHMAAKHYMIVDERRDHSFRIPRPDLSAALHTPNACNACHDDRSAQWAADQIAARFGGERAVHFAEVFHNGRARRMAAEKPLSAIAVDPDRTAIVRATALSLLRNYRRGVSADAIAIGLRDEDALVRIGALRGSQGMNLEMRWQLANPLLVDPLRAVRIEAVQTLAEAGRAPLSNNQRGRFDAALAEYFESQTLNDDRPEAHTNMGLVLGRLGNTQAAEAAYETALGLNPALVSALINLADLYRAVDRDRDGGALLRRAVEAAPGNATAHHAQGLWLVRQGNSEDALASLERARNLAPKNADFAYVYGVALNSSGASSQGLQVLMNAHQQFPEETSVLYALATIHRDRGDYSRALTYAEKLLALWPYERSYQQLVDQLRENPAARQR